MAEMNLYDVEFKGFTTQMKLSDEDAEGYGDRAKKVGKVKPAQPVPVASGSHADSDEKAAPAPSNKSRSAANKSS